jgi:O-antigen/teichoic acid export membrane protein
MVAGYTVMGALGQSATPRLARYYQSNRSAFKRLLAKMVLVAAAVGGAGILVAVLWGRPLLTLLYRPDYAQYHGLFILLMVSAGLSYIGSMLGYAIAATRKYETYIVPYTFVTIGTVAACWLLIPNRGMNGAGLASCAAAIMFIVAPSIILRKISRSGNGSPQRHFD